MPEAAPEVRAAVLHALVALAASGDSAGARRLAALAADPGRLARALGGAEDFAEGYESFAAAAASRNVGEVWEGTGGRYYTKRADGRVVPAKAPGQAAQAAPRQPAAPRPASAPRKAAAPKATPEQRAAAKEQAAQAKAAAKAEALKKELAGHEANYGRAGRAFEDAARAEAKAAEALNAREARLADARDDVAKATAAQKAAGRKAGPEVRKAVAEAKHHAGVWREQVAARKKDLAQATAAKKAALRVMDSHWKKAEAARKKAAPGRAAVPKAAAVPAPAPAPAPPDPGPVKLIDPDRPMGDRIAAYARGDRVVARVRAIAREAAGAAADARALQRQLEALPSARTLADREKEQDLLWRIDVLRTKAAGANRLIHEAMFEHVTDHADFRSHFAGDLTEGQRKAHEGGVGFLKKAFGHGPDGRLNLDPVPVRAIPAGDEQRPYHSIETGVHLHRDITPEVAAHEYAHRVEQANPEILEACKAFLEHRVRGEPAVSLRDRFPKAGYGADEVGRKDDFAKVFGERSGYYVGKDYGGRSTEVLSMGMEKLMRDPAAVAEKDPELFKFLLGVADGSLRARKTRPPADDDSVDLGF